MGVKDIPSFKRAYKKQIILQIYIKFAYAPKMSCGFIMKSTITLLKWKQLGPL